MTGDVAGDSALQRTLPGRLAIDLVQHVALEKSFERRYCLLGNFPVASTRDSWPLDAWRSGVGERHHQRAEDLWVHRWTVWRTWNPAFSHACMMPDWTLLTATPVHGSERDSLFGGSVRLGTSERFVEARRLQNLRDGRGRVEHA